MSAKSVELWNKCIGDDTKAAARQSPNCIKKIKYGEKRFSVWRMELLHHAIYITIMTLISSDDSTLQCGMWLWNNDSEFTKWQHPAVWYVALEWHAMELAQTSAILGFYIWFRFWPYHHSRHVILVSAKFYPNRTTLSRKKWRDVDFQDGGSQPSLILRGPIMVLWKAMHINGTIPLNCLVFDKIAFLHFGVKIQDSGSPPSWILGVP